MNYEDVDYNKFNTSNKFNYQTVIIILSITSVFILFSIYSDVKNKKVKSTATKGLNQIEVINLYYTSANNYEIGTVLSCVNSKKVNVINNGLIAKLVFNIRRNMEDNTHGGKQIFQEGIIFGPQDWILLGKPELKIGEIVEGIKDIEIFTQSKTEYLIKYEYYFTDIDYYTQKPIPQMENHTELCILKKFNGNWIIDQIIQK